MKRLDGSGEIEPLPSGRFRARLPRAFGRRAIGTFASEADAVGAIAEQLGDPMNPTLPRPIVPWPEVGGIYVVTHGLRVSVKIGHAQDIAARLATGACWLPDLELVAIVRDATRADERALHQRWRHERIGGEWFRATGPLAVFVREIRLRGEP